MKKLVLLALLFLMACESRAAPPPTPATQMTEAVLEKTVRHYYEVFDKVRATGDPSLIDAVSDPGGVDRSNVRAFAAEQLRNHKLSIITRESLSNWRFDIGSDKATVFFDYQASGYDIDSSTRAPLEAEVTLRPDRVVIELRRRGDLWLVSNRQRA